MRRLFGCPDIVSLTEKFLMARNFFRIFTENNPVMWNSKTFCIPEAKGLSVKLLFINAHSLMPISISFWTFLFSVICIDRRNWKHHIWVWKTFQLQHVSLWDYDWLNSAASCHAHTLTANYTCMRTPLRLHLIQLHCFNFLGHILYNICQV